MDDAVLQHAVSLKDLLEKKRQLEFDLVHLMAERLGEFMKDTKINVKDIRVEYIPLDVVGGDRKYRLSVECKLDI